MVCCFQTGTSFSVSWIPETPSPNLHASAAREMDHRVEGHGESNHAWGTEKPILQLYNK